MALEMLEFIDLRLIESRAAWNGPVPEYQVLVADVSMPSVARDTRLTLLSRVIAGTREQHYQYKQSMIAPGSG
jgi:hypothetical protein